jgi:HSP20 family protein
MANLVPFGRGRGLSAGFEDFYNMMDDFFNDPWFGGRRAREGFKLDIQRTDKEYLVEAELPGVRTDEISLYLREGTLTIAVNREENRNEENKNYIHRERRVSSMSRSVYLGDVDPDGVTAKLDNGVLKISVPSKAPVEKSRRIEIQ